MRTITIPIDLDTALALLEPSETLIELVATGPGVGITIGAARLVEEAAKIADPPPGTDTRTRAGSEEGAGQGEARREGSLRAARVRLRPGVRHHAGARCAPLARRHPPSTDRRCPTAPTHTDQSVGHRATAHTNHPSRAASTHQAVDDV